MLTVALVFTILSIPQFFSMLKKRLWKELSIALIILTLGFTYSLGVTYDWSLPNPTKRWELMAKPISNFLDKLLLPSGSKQ